MALNPNDLTLSISPSNPNNLVNGCVVGREFSFKIRCRNLSPTDPMYNLFIRLTLPDGISFVSSSLIPSTNNIISNQNIVTFVNIKDLYPNEANYDVEMTIKVDDTYRSNNSRIPYNLTFNNLSIYASVDSKPRGNIDSDNISITSTTTTTVKSLRYFVKVTYPAKYLKGAGNTPGPVIDATSIFDISIELTNTVRESSIVSLVLNLANGFRYIGQWATSGTNASNFTNPSISLVSQTQDHVKISLNNKTLSSNSTTILTFQVAIWNNYTANGIENSGYFISNGAALQSSLLISGNSTSYNSTFETSAWDLLISQSTETVTTDIFVLNEYTLNYSSSEYHALTDGILRFIIPDGMSYSDGSSTLLPTSIESINYTTVLTWDLGTISVNTTNSIRLYTVTNDTYKSTGADVFSTDNFITLFESSYLSPDESSTITDSDMKFLTVLAPIITTDVEGYYYNNLAVKNFDVAALGDYVKLSITYDATYVVANQKNVVLYDYPPLNISAAGVINIEVIGDIPPGTTYYPVPNNGAMVPLGNLNGGNYFKITFYLPVTEGIVDSVIYNLAKAVLTNSLNETTSLRDSALVYFGIPHLNITQSRDTTDCLSLNDSLNYEILIENTSDNNTNYIVDGFNINFNSSIPSILQIVSPPVITGALTHSSLSIQGNNYSMTITKLPPDEFIKITTKVQVNTLPIMGNDYLATSLITNGTCQQDPNSTPYTYNEYPLNDTLTLTGCTPTITKIYTPSTVKLYQGYSVALTIVFPKGGLAYNTKIKDSLVSTNSSYFTNVLLNGELTTYSLTTNNLTVPLLSTLDTTSGPITYLLTYDDLVVTATPVNYEQNKLTNASVDWSDELNDPENFQQPTTATLKIVVPGILSTKYQSNITKNLDYDINPVYFSQGDLINYKVNLSNIGKSPAYDILFTDTLPASFTYISNNIGGSYSSLTKKFSATINEINNDSNIDIIIQGVTNINPHWLTNNNSSASTFKANIDMPNIYISSNSNTTVAHYLADTTTIYKEQRNLTTEEAFTTSTIRCFYENSIEYKVYVTNPFNTSMINIIVQDTFPEQLTFVSHSTFAQGTINVTNNVVTTNISSISPNTTLSYTYIVTLNEITLSLESSSAVINYSFHNSPNIYTMNSNVLYLKLLELGKGFLVY